MVSVIPSSPPSNHLYPLLGGPTKIFPSDYTSCSLMWKSQASRDFRKCPRDWAHNTLSFLWPASLPCFQPSLEVTLIGIPRLPNNLFPVHLLPAKARKTIVSLVCLEVLRPNNSWLSPRGFVHPPKKVKPLGAWVDIPDFLRGYADLLCDLWPAQHTSFTHKYISGIYMCRCIHSSKMH